MACGKPVIMTKIEGIWDENMLKNKHNIMLINPNSIVELRKAIEILLNNQDLYKNLSLNGPKLVKNYFNVNVMSECLRIKIGD